MQPPPKVAAETMYSSTPTSSPQIQPRRGARDTVHTQLYIVEIYT